MSGRAVHLVVTRNQFYERNYRSIVLLFLLQVLITGFLLGFISYQSNTNPKPKYLPTTPDGVYIDSPPININHLVFSQQTKLLDGRVLGMPEDVQWSELEPMGEDALIKYWTEIATVSMFNTDYVHYKRSVQDARIFFTAKGHSRFIQALIESRNLETVKNKKAVVSTELNGDIEIVRRFMIAGHYAWNIHVPIKIAYDDGLDDPLIQKLTAKLLVIRVSTLEVPFYGLAVSQVNFGQPEG